MKIKGKTLVGNAAQKVQSFRDTFQSGDKVKITYNDPLYLNQIGYITRKTPDYVYVMLKDTIVGFRFDGIEMIESASKKRYPLTPAMRSAIIDFDENSKWTFTWSHQLPKAIKWFNLDDILKKGFYTNMERFMLIWLDVNYFNRGNTFEKALKFY
jgi:hypothetical protein